MATHSNILAWKISWTEKPGRLQSMESQRVRHDLSDLAVAAAAWLRWLSGKETVCQHRSNRRCGFDLCLGRYLGIGNGNPLQYSCLEISMEREAWWVTVHGAAKSQTRVSEHTHTHTHTYAHMAQVTLLVSFSKFN